MKFLLFFIPILAMATPQGLQVMSGCARQEGNQIHVSESSVLQWDSYSIAADEHIHYPSPHTTLNRVIGKSVSHLDGHLTSNGPLWLINPNGIVIGEHGQINAASFLASTLDLLDGHTFKGDRGSILQKGLIECPGGYVVLMGVEGVVQEGRIYAEKVAIGAGREIEFSPELFRVNGNLGRAAIQCKGLIEAKRLEERGGEVYLMAEGLCEVEDAEVKAEVVHVSGNTVGVLGKTIIDVSGKNGGTILIGGDYQGKNSEVRNAEVTVIGKEVMLKADALENGDGGKIIVWSDRATRCHGKISVRGGEKGGDGGLAEVSGKNLDYQGLTDSRAPKGKYGKLLLDPINVTISTGADSANVTNPGGGGTYTFTGCAPSPAIINDAGLSANLELGSVTISTNAAGSEACTDDGDLLIDATAVIDWNAATTLTLVGNQRIRVLGIVANHSATTGFDAVHFTGNGVPAGSYDGVLVDGVGVETDGGNIVMIGTSGSAGGGGVVVTSPGTLVTSANGNIEFTGTGQDSNPGIFILNSGNVTTTGTGDITIEGTCPGTSAGIIIQTSGFVESASGTIALTGDSVFREGIFLLTPDAVQSTSGDILLSGTSTGNQTDAIGVRISNSTSTGTTGQVVFSNCQGGTGTSNHGISITASFTTGGDFIAIDSILSGTGSGSHGFNGTANITASGNIEILATSQAGGSTASHGINYTGASTTMSSAGDITLIGIGPTGNSGTCHGVNLTGIVTTSGAGTIQIAGNARGTGVGTGILVSTSTNRITSSGGGAIQLSGVSTATGSSSHGISWTSSWTTSTAGAVTFGAPITIDATTITGCQGGTGGTSHGINAGAAFTTSGSVTATNLIVGGTGTGSHGFSSSSSFSTSGNPITITASTTAGGSTASHGINYTSGTMSGSSITLNGTTSSSNTGASNGINLTSGTLSSTGGTVSLTGTAVATAGSSSRGILLSATNPITSSGNSAITLNGTSHATGSSCHGVSITSSAWVTGSTADLDITGVADGGGATTFPINLGGSTTHSGNIDFNNAVGLSANTTIIDNGDASKTILFTDTVNGTTAGGQSLTLTAGSATVSIQANIGFATAGRLNLFTMTGDSFLLNANIKAFQGSITAPITVSGDFELTATAID